jgi:hypothetical protein
MDDDRESRRQLARTFDELASTSERARAVIGPYQSAIKALECAADELWQLGELRFAASLESRVVDMEIQARRHLQAIGDREREAAKQAAAEASHE